MILIYCTLLIDAGAQGARSKGWEGYVGWGEREREIRRTKEQGSEEDGN